MKAVSNLFHAIVPPGFYPSSFVRRRIAKVSAGRVMTGPFRGMHYVADSVGSTYLPKLLGIYELEIHELIEELCQEAFDTILNIGAAEGYYAVGLALRLPGSQIVAFEVEASGQQLIRQLARLNDVEHRIAVHGLCDAPGLSGILQRSQRPLILMDVEGAEAELLSPAIAPEFRTAHILVELHDSVYGPAGEPISDRFNRTHTIREIWQRERSLQDLPLRFPAPEAWFLRKYIQLAMEEYRSEKTRWFYLKPN